MQCRFLLPAPPHGWAQLALGEWELSGGGFGDCHPHDEVNWVLEGRLLVTCDGERVEADPGDVVRVPAGRPAWYEAPERARMLHVYGANPEGRASLTFAGAEETARCPGLGGGPGGGGPGPGQCLPTLPTRSTRSDQKTNHS